MADKTALQGIKRIVLVASGKGGVGKSTIAAHMSAGLAQSGLRIGLLDADFHGPSIPTMFGVAERPKVRNQRIQPIECYGVRLLSVGVLASPQHAFVWRGSLLRGVLKQFLYDTDWGELDMLVIDLPPGTGEMQIALLEALSVYGAVVVTTPQNVAGADVRRSLTMFSSLGVRVLGLVENMATYICPHCGEISKVFLGNSGTELAQEFGIKLLVQLPLWSNIAVRGDTAIPTFPFTDANDSGFSIGLSQLIRTVAGDLIPGELV